MEESPERTIPAVSAHSPIVQDSPFFRYLDNLSPIKPVKSVHVAQTFSELNFPPPPAVFTSPRVSCQKEANFLKSCVRSCQDDMGEKQSNAIEHESDQVKSSCDGTAPVVDKGEEPKSLYRDSDKSNVENKSTHLPVGYFVDLSDQRDHSKVSSETISSVELPTLKDTAEYACDSTRNNDKFSEPNAIEEFTDPQNDISEMDTSESMEDKSLQVVDGGGETTSSKSGCDELTVPLSTLDLDNKDSVQATDNTQNFQASSNNAESFAEHDNGSFTFLLSKDSGCTTGVWHKVPSAEYSSDMFEQGFKDVPSNCEMNCEQSDVDCTPQPLHDSFLSSEISDEPNIKIDNPQTRPTEHHISLICKEQPLCQPHRGMRRRCLDFEATEAQKKIVNSSLKQMKTNTASESFSKAPDAVSSLSFSQVREEVADGKQHLLNQNSLLDKDGKSLPSLTMRFSNCFSKATDPISEKPEKSVKNCVTPQMSGGMPSGIGLHLNSLATTMPTSCNANVLLSAKVPVSMQAVMPFKGVKEACPDITDGSYSSINQDGNALPGSNTKSASCMALSVLEKPGADQHELMSSGMRKTGLKKTASSSQSLAVTLKPLQTKVPSKFEERNESPLDKKRSTQPEKNQQSLFNSCDELSQGSPKKKRRKSSSSTDKEGCKRCNCKKSKCLKLYCECFAAGVYCVEPCTCLECFNKPEYEDMVLGTRQQIESRNPLAFAPKIVRNSDSPPIIGDECGETPASARHKRGCNCKKSMCLKKYCECYQAGVGCSDGCRCESCKNIYGKKDAGLSESENRAALDETIEMDSSEDKMELLESEVDNVHLEQQQNDISPITPSLHCISQGRSMAKLKSGCKRHINSEELDSSTLSQSSARPPKSPAKFARSMKVHHGNGTCSSQSHFGSRKFATSILTTQMDKSGQISQNWDGQTNMCTITPILHPPMRPAASVSNADGTASSPFSGPNSEISGSSIRQLATRHTCHGGSPPVFHHQISCSPLCCSESNHWQSPLSVNGTPLTPSHSSTACNGTTKNPENSDYDIHSHNASVSAEDDTPDILKNSCSPTRGLKANSPNQKRVSPPHNCYGKEKSRGFISSPGLKSGRKFILQSLSSFPLTTLTCEDHIKD